MTSPTHCTCRRTGNPQVVYQLGIDGPCPVHGNYVQAPPTPERERVPKVSELLLDAIDTCNNGETAPSVEQLLAERLHAALARVAELAGNLLDRDEAHQSELDAANIEHGEQIADLLRQVRHEQDAAVALAAAVKDRDAELSRLREMYQLDKELGKVAS